jgi:hypothetical protein
MASIGHDLPVGSVLRSEGRAQAPTPGATLEDLLARGPLQPARALELLGQVAATLDLDPDREMPLQYVSPERILGQDVGPRSDVYSLSAILYHCLTGSVPFPRGRDRAVLFWHLHAPRPRATTVRPDLRPAIDRVLARGMAIDAAARHPTARALIEDARQALCVDPPAERSAAQQGRATRRRGPLVPLAAVIALAAGGAGYATGDRLDDPQPRSGLASAGRVELAAPADWRRTATTAERFTLGLTDPLVLTRSGEGRLIAGTTTDAASVALLSRLDAAPPSGELVALARAQARRYRAARPPGLAGPLTLYLAPTDRGIATVACLAERASAAASFMPRCEQVAASLRLAAGRFAPAGPSGRQASGLRRAFERLNAARSRYRSRAERSRTAAGQAPAARALASAHAREARALRALELTGLARPGGRAAIGSLERAASAYRALGKAAADRDRRGYRIARRSVLAADVRIRRALEMLHAVGYAA